MLQKTLNYRVNGYQVPFIPKAPRSTRKRGHIQKKVEERKICAFDLLATVAGKLLHEGGSYEGTSDGKYQSLTIEDVINEQHYEGNLPKLEHCDGGSDEISFLPLNPGLQDQAAHCNVGEVVAPHHDILRTPTSAINVSDCLEKDNNLNKMVLHHDKGEWCSNSGKQECCSAMVPLNSHVNLPLVKDQCFRGSIAPSRGENSFKVDTRNKGQNLSEYTQPCTTETTRSWVHIGDRRIRKLSGCKYWRGAPKMKFAELFDTELCSMYHSRKFGYKRQRSKRIYPFNKRKNFRYNSFSKSDGEFGHKGFYSPPEKVDDKTASGFCAVGHGVNDPTSCVAVQSTTFPSRDSHVKLRIESFRVPELFIELPETATIGSLKTTVMEAVTALLGGGLHVGILLQGKKVRDDSRTLLQSGICHDDKVDSALGFTLEPNPSLTSLPIWSEDKSLTHFNDVHEPVLRCPGTSTIHLETSHVSSDHPVTDLGNVIEIDQNSSLSLGKIPAEKGTVDSQAIVTLPEGTSRALTVVATNPKFKRPKIGHRRIRRPFSVVEVEALVQAVEKLGTGRWRDVKLQAFNRIMNRTYVDLKDKWKTLVHTATISPHQRRGAPVPHKLLDRVLAAHAYWSQQQAKN